MGNINISNLHYMPLITKDFKLCVDSKYPQIVRQAHPYVQGYLDNIIDFAKDSGVKKLYLFGSAITDAYSREVSDIDFAAEGEETSQQALHKSISSLLPLGKEFDLVDISWFEGSFLQNIENGVVLYAENSDK